MLDPQAFINTVAARWSMKHPTQADKIMRAAMLVLADKVTVRSSDTWHVVGSKGDLYLVEFNCGFPRCSCPDFKFHKKKYEGSERKERCFHIWATALFARLMAERTEEIPSPIEKKSTPKKKQSESLGELCQRLHTENAKRAALVLPCPVISIHQRRES